MLGKAVSVNLRAELAIRAQAWRSAAPTSARSSTTAAWVTRTCWASARSTWRAPTPSKPARLQATATTSWCAPYAHPFCRATACL